MKAFLASLVAIVVVAAVAYIALDQFDNSSQAVYQSKQGSVRLN
jgi:hypothetical protein